MADSDAPPGGRGLIPPALLKWALLLALALLFVAGILEAYDRATGGPRSRERIVGVESERLESGAPSAAAAARAEETFRSGGVTERVEALGILAAADPERGRAVVIEALGDPNAPIRQRALELLAAYRFPVPAPRVAQMLTDADPGVRAAASALLILLPYDPAVLYLLNTPLASSDPTMVASALDAWRVLAPNDPTAAANVLASVIGSADPALVEMAVAAARGLPAASLGALKPGLLSAASRHAGTSGGDAAAALAAEIP